MIIDGKAIAEEIEKSIQADIKAIQGRKPCVAVIIVGEHAPSLLYVSMKGKACERVGIRMQRIDLPNDISETELLSHIDKLNNDDTIDGILVQLPLPQHMNTDNITDAIIPEKDVDGFHPINAGKVLIGRTDAFIPCTPLGVHYILQHIGVDIAGQHVVIVGRSNIVGKPLAALLMQKGPGCNATVTVAHSRTQDLASICRSADVLIAAAGQPSLITADMVKEGAVVIDVGTNRVEDATRKKGFRIVGDVDFDNVKDRCSFISPVPGGVGPMTIVMVLKNTLQSYQQRNAAR